MGRPARRVGRAADARPSFARRCGVYASEACLPADVAPPGSPPREERELRREVLIEPLAELGLVAFDGPNDPEPSLVIEDGRVVELDGRRREDWDALDHFIARSGLDLEVARRGRRRSTTPRSHAGSSTSTCHAPSSCASRAASRRRGSRA